MTIQAAFALLRTYQQFIVPGAIAVPVITFAISFIHGVYDGRRAPWRQLYALVVHLTTAAAMLVAALVVYHIAEGGSPLDAEIPRWVVITITVTWILTLLVVSRAVDFAMIPGVRTAWGLILTWAVAWAASSVAWVYSIALLPGPLFNTVAAGALIVFLVVRLVLRLTPHPRERS